MSPFLTQVSETLRLEAGSVPFPDASISSSAARHGCELLAKGYTVSQVVHDYGDVCQAITELAVEREVAIRPEEFHTLNRCLDTAIAEAVTEYARLQGETTSRREVERLGQLAHELRNLLNIAFLSFDVLKTGRVGIGGSTGAALGRALADLSSLIDTALSEARQVARAPQSVWLSLRGFVAEVAVAARMDSDGRGLRLTVEPVDSALHVDSSRSRTSAEGWRRAGLPGRARSATGAGAIVPGSGLGSPSPGRRSRRSAARSTRATSPARAASSSSTSPPSTGESWGACFAGDEPQRGIGRSAVG